MDMCLILRQMPQTISDAGRSLCISEPFAQQCRNGVQNYRGNQKHYPITAVPTDTIIMFVETYRVPENSSNALNM